MALLLYALYSLFARALTVPPRLEPWLSPVIGLATGVTAGATGVFTLPAVPYLQGLGLEKEDLVQAMGLSFTVSTIALAIGLTGGGAFHLADAAISALAIIPALAGMWIGTIVRDRISAKAFRRGFLGCLALLGLDLMIRPLL